MPTDLQTPSSQLGPASPSEPPAAELDWTPRTEGLPSTVILFGDGDCTARHCSHRRVGEGMSAAVRTRSRVDAGVRRPWWTLSILSPERLLRTGGSDVHPCLSVCLSVSLPYLSIYLFLLQL